MHLSPDEQYRKKWDDRYLEEGYAYGEQPNVFFKTWLDQFPPGAILMPADGEGRNGVYAAGLGWQVTATDLSSAGREKALQLARQRNVSLEYLVGDLEEMDFAPGSFDAIGLIYAHFPAEKKLPLLHKLSHCLKPGGIVIFEAFGKNHLQLIRANPKVGGPTEEGMLFSIADIESTFSQYTPLLLVEAETELQEGAYHNGKGSVVRFVGRKPF